MKRKLLVVALIMTFLIVGCSMFTGIKPWKDRSAEEKELFFKQTYNSQYDDTMALATKPNLTEGEKKIVRLKKSILTEARTAIDLYSIYIAQGKPTAALEAQILNLFDKLVSLAEGGA